MVSALKINNHNNKSGLELFIEKFSREAKKESYQIEEETFIDRSVQKLAVNSIIEGYFPKENLVKDMAIKRVNKYTNSNYLYNKTMTLYKNILKVDL